MKRVIIESPYAGPDTTTVVRNIEYARRALRDCLQRGEAPIASHLLYTQPGVLDDNRIEERALGIQAGLIWGEYAEATVAYVDHGISEGMIHGLEDAQTSGRQIEFRRIGKKAAPCQ